MITISLEKGEGVVIDDTIVVKVMEIRGVRQIRLAISAPEDKPITRDFPKSQLGKAKK